ncbi:MAG: OmpA family protein [Pedobacter sp.]|nr:MAG: OmpA family protein [Pedobacter sp.]
MNLNASLSKVFVALSIAATMSSCSSSDHKDQTVTSDSTTVMTSTTAAAPPVTEGQSSAPVEAFKDFDWNTVPKSTADIGAFPYLSAPAGLYIGENDSYSKSKTGYSTLQDFNMLIMFDGQSFYKAEGKVAKMKYRMIKDNTEYDQYGFDSSVDKYLASIGAKLIGKLQLNQAQTAFLNKDDELAIHKHIIGDPYNVPVRFYALNHSSGRIMFQVFSNTASGETAVVQLAAFEQTIKAPNAMQMKKDIDANGKAILNINFDTDKSNLLSDGQKVVDEILLLMKNNPGLKIAIEGHTDNAGSGDHNKKLSTDRANTILKSLTSRGIAASRLSATGFGAERPLVANDSEANMAKNRRVELVKK